MYIYILKYISENYSVVIINEMLSCTTAWINVEIILYNETQKCQYSMMSFKCGLLSDII